MEADSDVRKGLKKSLAAAARAFWTSLPLVRVGRGGLMLDDMFLAAETRDRAASTLFLN